MSDIALHYLALFYRIPAMPYLALGYNILPSLTLPWFQAKKKVTEGKKVAKKTKTKQAKVKEESD